MGSDHCLDISGHCSAAQPVAREERGQTSELEPRRDLKLKKKILAALAAGVSERRTVMKVAENLGADQRRAAIPDEIPTEMLLQDVTLDPCPSGRRYNVVVFIDYPRPTIDQPDLSLRASKA